MKKIDVIVKVKVTLKLRKGVDLEDVVNEMDYNFSSTTDGANVYDTTIEDFEVR